ncbi:MAG: adenosine kinase, partial [Pseudomonadota bacterium]
MTDATELLGISNAIVDILTHVEDRFLEDIGAPRGSMILIDAQQADALYERMGPTTEMSGGSVGNSVAGFAVLGGEAAYIGRVADDQFGAVFDHDMRSLGIDMRLPPETRAAPTARSHVLISPDGQRTMQTYLGACGEIAVSDITDESVGAPGLVLIEGYIFDTPEGPASVEKAMSLALAKGARIALSLSDAMCVDRHLGEFRDLVGKQIRIVVGNDDEFKAL